MESDQWLSEDADERLEGLFSDRPELVVQTVRDLLHDALSDPEVEELLIETLQTSLTEENDDTQATAWMVVVLGELRSQEAIGPLIEALVSSDEMVASASVRALRKIGAPALERMLDLLEEGEVGEDLYLAGVEVLHAAYRCDDPRMRERSEEFLLSQVGAPCRAPGDIRRVESAALALAHLGAQSARSAIEAALQTAAGRNNSFLKEALEIIAEHPTGLPTIADAAWESEFQWALVEELPGGEIVPLREDAPLAARMRRKRARSD